MKNIFKNKISSALSSSFLPKLYSLNIMEFAIARNKRIRNFKIFHEDEEKKIYEAKVDKALRVLKDWDKNDVQKHVEKAQQMEAVSKIQSLDSHYNRILKNEERIDFLKRATGLSQENIKSNKSLSLNKFNEIKKYIIERYPRLAHLDYEKGLEKITDPEARVDYIVDNFFLNKDKDYREFYEIVLRHYDGEEEIILLKYSKDLLNKIDVYLNKKQDDLKKKLIEDREKVREEELKMKTKGKKNKINKEQEEALEKAELEYAKRDDFNFHALTEVLERIDPSEITKMVSKQECEFLVSLPYHIINIHEALEKGFYKTEEYRLARIRALYKDNYLKRYNDNEDWEPLFERFTHDTKMIFGRLKNQYDLTYLPRFKEKVSSYAKTFDNHRIDVGMIITRLPIFLNIEQKELDNIMYKKSFNEKFGVNLDVLKKDFESFNPYENKIFKDIENIIINDKNNEPNIRLPKSEMKTLGKDINEEEINNNTLLLKDNSPDDPYLFYYDKSKHYMRVDPSVHDNRHLQTDPCWDVYFIAKNKHTGQWEFPTIPIYNGQQLREGLEYLIRVMTENRFTSYFPGLPCLLQTTRDFYTYEKDDKNNKNLLGVKTLYYIGYHDSGNPYVSTSVLHNYNDCLLVKKDDLNKYFDKEYYKVVVPSLK